METNRKATLKYNHGWMIVLPKNDNAPMLFLEWLSREFRAASNKMHYLKDLPQDNCLHVRLNAPKAEYVNCITYINDNLPTYSTIN